jgi:hypothetical protein
MININYLKVHKIVSTSNLFKRYSIYIYKKKYISNNNYPAIFAYNDWFSYLIEFKKFFKMQPNQFVIINYDKYNYNLVKYMCLKKKGHLFSILDFCSAIGIPIPHYCYHPDLSIAGNCRMCLVHIEGSIKPVVSCAIILTPGMIINTNSFFVKKIHESVLEFLLLNHPLDCPTCDRGGECDLQELNLSYGSDRGRIFHKLDLKRSINDMNCNPFVKFTLTRCIYCTRCVRFLNEFDGNSHLGLLGRGHNSEIVCMLIIFYILIW